MIGGGHPFYLKFESNWPRWSEIAYFQWIFARSSAITHSEMCIYFSNFIYRHDGVNFYYAVEALVQLTDIFSHFSNEIFNIKKNIFVSGLARPTFGGGGGERRMWFRQFFLTPRVHASTITETLYLPLCSELAIQSASSKISWFLWFTSLSHHRQRSRAALL